MKKVPAKSRAPPPPPPKPAAAAAAGGGVGGGGGGSGVEIIGLYFALRDRMHSLEPLLCDFYTRLLRQLGLLGRMQVTLDGREQTLTEELMQSVINSPEQTAVASGADESDCYRLFRGGYIRLFEDGSAFQKIMYRVFDCLGDPKIMWIRWKSEFRLANKSNPKLRTFYRFVDDGFVSQLPLAPYVSFTVDALLYCEWRVTHPNLIGFHLLILTWMLNVAEFKRFVPAYLKSARPIADPLLKHFWRLSGVRVQLDAP